MSLEDSGKGPASTKGGFWKHIFIFTKRKWGVFRRETDYQTKSITKAGTLIWFHVTYSDRKVGEQNRMAQSGIRI